MLAQLVKAVPKEAMWVPPKIVTCTYSSQGTMNAGSPCGEGVRVRTSNTEFNFLFSFFLFFHITNRPILCDKKNAPEKLAVFHTHGRWPNAKEMRGAPQKHLPLAIWLHVTGAVRESLSLLAENARACFRTLQIYSIFYSSAIRLEAKSNIVLFASIFESFKYLHSPTNLSRE